MLPIGTPIPWDLYSRAGRIVFRKGFVIHSAANIERLLSMDLHVGFPAAGHADDHARATKQKSAAELLAHSRVGPLRTMEQFADQITDCFAGVRLGHTSAGEELRRIIAAARDFYRRHPDTCVAAVHFNHGRSYQALQPLYSLFLALLVAGTLEWDEARSAVLAGVALTANIGLSEVYDEWVSQPGRLDVAQDRLRLQHPRRSVERLQDAGVSDPDWLRAVLQHHEWCDGSGYPEGLVADEISQEALIVGLVERYLSCILPRRGRQSVLPGEALKWIYDDAGKHGIRNISPFIKALGVNPPGTAVILANGEIAVVKRRGVEQDAMHPVVVSVRLQGGKYLDTQPQRDTREPPYCIRQAYLPGKGEINPALMVRSWR